MKVFIDVDRDQSWEDTYKSILEKFGMVVNEFEYDEISIDPLVEWLTGSKIVRWKTTQVYVEVTSLDDVKKLISELGCQVDISMEKMSCMTGTKVREDGFIELLVSEPEDAFELEVGWMVCNKRF